MTFLHLPLIAAALTLAAPPLECARPITTPGERRAFTNADLERIAACRKQTEARPAPDEPSQAKADPPAPRRTTRSARFETTGEEPFRPGDALEADWRARWRSVDQKVRRLKREAEELRHEANDAPRDPKKKPTGRRSPQILLRRAHALETEAAAIEDEFQAEARREGALPGWLRAR